jgi:hypothetical protein
MSHFSDSISTSDVGLSDVVSQDCRDRKNVLELHESSKQR